ncbi:hypothetical protein V1506DRAFT_481113 [Lipomyces tetrasporus]
MASSSPTHPEGDQYQRALDFLSANEPEQCLRVQLTIDKYEELVRHAENLYGEKKYPYVDYCPDTSMVIIYTAPSSLHGMVSAHLPHLIQQSAEIALTQHNKPDLAKRLMSLGESSDRPSFGGYDSRVSKTPDGGLIYTFNNEDVLALVIETGLTEDYQKLQKDIRLWLHGMHCRTGMLICLQEEPKFKSSRKRRMESLDDFRRAIAETSNETPFGPYIYNDHTWFGKLASVSVEVHRRVDADGDNRVEPKVSTEAI